MLHELQGWHDFYILIGTASATLIGLMFVAASVGASVFNADREAPLRALLTPTVVHFGVVLAACLAGMVPALTRASLGALLIVIGLVGVAFALRAGLNLLRRWGGSATKDWEDELFYGYVPIAAHLALIAAGIVTLIRPALGLDILAGTLVALLLLGIHNAWDMTLW
ncbi:MAG: hypothetical protein ACREFY_06510, partial [Acetobacteraceae bacterium]